MEEFAIYNTRGSRRRIKTPGGRGAATRTGALRKLGALQPIIGAPAAGSWGSDFELPTTTQTFLAQTVEFASRRNASEVARVGRAVDRAAWPSWVPTTAINAGFNEFANQLIFPAGVLQLPLFDASRDAAVNFGAIGAALGHELMHAFDAQGCSRDHTGMLRNWCSAADLRAFAGNQRRLARQYSAYVVFDTFHVDGVRTVSENLADLGGLQMAYAAHQRWLARHGRPGLIDGSTPEQRFFLAYAAAFRAKVRPELERTRLLSDDHAPARFRVIGVLRSMPEFAQAFHCRAGDSMFITAAHRVVVF